MQTSSTNKKHKAFTLVEMMVVVFIIGFVSTILIVNWQKSKKQYLVDRVAQEIAQNIRKTQDMALNSNKYDNQIPNYSYGLYFNSNQKTSYTIFGDKNRNNTYQGSSSDMLISSIVMDPGIEIDYLYPYQSGLFVSFSLPDGFTTIVPPANSAIIRIKRTNTTCPSVSCKTITVYSTGQITIK